MAIAHVASVTLTPASFVGNSDHTVDLGAGSDRFATVAAGYRGTAPEFTTCSYNGTSFTAFGAEVTGGTQGEGRAFHLKNPATGSNTLRLNNGTGTNLTAVFLVSCYSGVDQTTPFDGYATNGGSGTPATLTVTSAAGDVPYFFAGGFPSSYTSSAPTNYTERGDAGNGASFGTGGEGTGAASVNFSAALTASSIFGWVTMGWNMNAAGGGGAVVTNPYYYNYYQSVVLGLAA